MAKDPAVLFYTSDFLTGTLTLSNEQVGKYIRLLCLQHQKGELTEKDMYNICSTYDEDIFSKFEKIGDKFINVRMRDETIKRKEYSKSRSENRKKKISKSYEKDMNNISDSYVKHMENENENINIIVDKGGVGEKENFIVIDSEKIYESNFKNWFNKSFQFQIPNWERLFPKAPFDDALKEFMLKRAFEKFNDHSHFRNSFAIVLKDIQNKNNNAKPGKSLATTIPVNEGKKQGGFRRQ